MTVIAVNTAEHAKNEAIVAEVAKPLTQSKISWLSIANIIQGIITAAMVGGELPPIPGIPVSLQPLVGVVLNGLVIFFRQKLAKQARA